MLEEEHELFHALFNETGEPAKIGFSKEEIFGLFDLRNPKGPIRLVALGLSSFRGHQLK